MKQKLLSIIGVVVTLALIFAGLNQTSANAAKSADAFPTSRDPIYWPFSAISPWNMPIHDSAQYVPAGIHMPLAYGPTYDEEILILEPSAPLKQVMENNAGWSGASRCSSLTGGVLFGGTSVPVPSNFHTDPGYDGNTPNMSAAILMPDGVTLKHTQPLHVCSDGGVVTSQYTWPDNNIKTSDGLYGSHGGTGMSAIGGSLRVNELLLGSVIHHALKMNFYALYNYAYNNDGTRGYRWPATQADSYASSSTYGGDVSAFEVGALLALKPDFNVASLQTEPARIIAQAAQDYGIYAVDDTAWDVLSMDIEWGPDGRVADQFLQTYGWGMGANGQLANCTATTNDCKWSQDLWTILSNLNVVNNNTSTTIGGGPNSDTTNRRAPMAPPFIGQATATAVGPTNTPVPVAGAVNSVRFYPRSGWAARMNGGIIQSSNTSATSGFVNLGTISSAPPDNQWTTLNFSNSTVYRYIRYQSPTGGYGNVAELEFYAGATRLSGTGFGTAGSWSGTSTDTFDKALDGNTSTFFDSATADGNYVGIDTGPSGPTNTPVVPTNTPVPPTATRTNTPVPPTNTPGASTSYEAESSANTLAGTAAVAACTVCSGGNKVGNVGNGAANTLQFNNVNVSSAGSYNITIYYLNGDTAARTASMSVNGGAGTNVSFPQNGAWPNPNLASISVAVSLNAGNNTLKFSNASAWAPDFDRIVVPGGTGPTNTPVPPTNTPVPPTATSSSTSYEAESSANTLAGTAAVSAYAACSGGQRVGNVGNGAANTLQFNNVYAASAGSKSVTIYYLNGDSGNRTASMSVNGGGATVVTFPASGTWPNPNVTSITINVTLNAGNNTLKFSNASAWAPDFDRIVVIQ